MASRACPAVLVLAAVLAAMPLASADEADELFNLANGLMSRLEYGLAVETYSRLIAAHPTFTDTARARHRRAWCLYEVRRYEECEKGFRELLAKHPDFADAPKARYRLAEALLHQKKPAEAADAFVALADASPDFAFAATALHRAGEALSGLKKYADAAKVYARLIAGYPTYRHIAYAHYSLGWCHVQLEAYPAAAKAFAAVVAKFPESRVAAESQYRLGVAHLQFAGRTSEADRRAQAYRDAVAAFQTVLEKFPGPYAPEALHGIGSAYFEQKRYVEAAEAFGRVATRFPDSPAATRARALYDAGNSFYWAERFADATRAFDQVLELVPGQPLAQKAVYARGLCYLKAEQPAKAIAAFTASLAAPALADNLARVTYSLAEANLAAGRHDAAAQAYTTVVERHAKAPVAADALSALAFCRRDQGKLPEAIAAAGKFVATYPPEHPLYKATLFALGDFQFAAKNFADALAAFEKLQKLGPAPEKADWTLYRLGWCHRQLKAPDQAAPRFAQLVARYPKSPLAPESLCLVARIADEQKDPDTAARRYAQCFTDYPDSPYAPLARVDLGLLHFNRKQFDQAAAHLKFFVENHAAHKSLPEARLHLAEALYETKAYDDALVHFAAFLDAHPAHDLEPRARDGIAWTHRKLDQPNKAAPHFLALVEKHPDSDRAPGALFAAANIRVEQKRHADAHALFARLPAAYPTHKLAVEAAYRAASALCDAADFEKAETALAAFLDQHAKSDFADDALYDLGWALRKLKKADDVAAPLERLLADFPTSDLVPATHFLLGEHHYDAKDYARSAKHYQACAAATKADDERAKALYKLAWSHYNAEKLPDAAKAFDALLARFPDTGFAAEAHYLSGVILQKGDAHAQAVTRFEQALAAGPPAKYRERALYQTGQSQQALGKWALALKAYQATLDDFPAGDLRLDATYGLGLASQHLGAYADAEDAFRKVIAETKTELAARAQYGLGECSFLQDKYKEALPRLLAVEIRYAYKKWRAAALLKTMECHAKLGNPARVRFYHADLTKKFPDSEFLPAAQKLVDALPKDKPAPKD